MPTISLRTKGFRLALVAAGGLCLGCTSESSEGTTFENGAPSSRDASPDIELRLRDVTAESGVSAVYRNGREAGEYAILESLGGGVAILDYDRDGVLDLFFPGGGTISPERTIAGLPSSLWRGRGDFRFDSIGGLAGAAESRYYTHGCAAADFDNDGFCDLLVTGYGGLQLFRNQGDGTFLETATLAGLNDSLWSSSAAWGDFDGDGSVDLYVTHYVDWSWENHPRCNSSGSGGIDVCGPREFGPLDDVIYYSNSDGTFRDATTEAGLVAGGKGLGVIAADIDLDGRTDVYVANDTTVNFLYLNEGGVFREAGLISGTAVDEQGVPNGSMGIGVLDFDGDLRPDLWVANYENETFALYRNEGRGGFLPVSERSGIATLGGLFVGFGTVPADLDLDGDEDLVVANGHVMYHSQSMPGPQQAFVLRNDGDDRFTREDFPDDSYFSQGHWGRGLAAGDLDGDADLDLVFSNVNEPAAILANETEPSHRPVAVRLVGTRSNRDGIGASMILETTAGRFFRCVYGGGSYLSQSDYAQVWGIPKGAEIKQLTIRWPSGVVQQVDGEGLMRDAIVVER